MQLPSLKRTFLPSSFQRPHCGQVAESKFKLEKPQRPLPPRQVAKQALGNLVRPRVRMEVAGGNPGETQSQDGGGRIR